LESDEEEQEDNIQIGISYKSKRFVSNNDLRGTDTTNRSYNLLNRTKSVAETTVLDDDE